MAILILIKTTPVQTRPQSEVAKAAHSNQSESSCHFSSTSWEVKEVMRLAGHLHYMTAVFPHRWVGSHFVAAYKLNRTICSGFVLFCIECADTATMEASCKRLPVVFMRLP